MKTITENGEIKSYETDLLSITMPDEYSCGIQMLEDKDDIDRDYANLSRIEVLELATIS